MGVLIVAAVVFLGCFLVDRGYAKLFRSKAQHRSGLSIRQNKRYGTIGVVLAVIGIAAAITGGLENTALMIGGIVVGVLGIGLIAYYMATGIYYDEDAFLWESFGKKQRTYRYDEIIHQQLYTMQGGGLIVELHMTDGSAVQVVSTMPDYRQFLNFAFQRYCQQKGLIPENCTFHDPENGLWFPTKEENECTSQV